jgi:hypothetical protein
LSTFDVIYDTNFVRNAYMVLANAVPQVLSISNPLSVQPTCLQPIPGLGTSISKDSWPKPSDYNEEKLKSLLWYRKMWVAEVGDKKGMTGVKPKQRGKATSVQPREST